MRAVCSRRGWRIQRLNDMPPHVMFMDLEGWEEVSPHEELTMPDPAPETRQWCILPHDGRELPAAVFFLYCPRTVRLAIIIDATPEEQAAALANPCRRWHQPERVRLLKR